MKGIQTAGEGVDEEIKVGAQIIKTVNQFTAKRKLQLYNSIWVGRGKLMEWFDISPSVAIDIEASTQMGDFKDQRISPLGAFERWPLIACSDAHSGTGSLSSSLGLEAMKLCGEQVRDFPMNWPTAHSLNGQNESGSSTHLPLTFKAQRFIHHVHSFSTLIQEEIII